MSPDQDKERSAAEKVGSTQREKDQARDRTPGAASSGDRGAPTKPGSGTNENVAPPTRARGDELDLGTDAEIAAPEGPRGESEPWHRLSTRHDEDVQTAERTAKPRDREAVEGSADVVAGFTDTSQTGDMSGRSVYGMRDETEEEDESEER